jgi:cytochrome c-type biogenesis protein CcmH/NrfG
MKFFDHVRRSGSRAVVLALVLCIAAAAGAAAQGRGPAALRPITVITEPGATVWVAGVRYGVADDQGRLAIATIAPGVRVLRVRADGFAEVTRTLPATARGDITVKLVKTTDEATLAFQAAERQTTIDREKAIAEYNRAVKLRPDFADAYIGLARAYSERGDVENAFKAIRSAKRLRPNAEALAVEGRILKDIDEEEKAIAAFKLAIAQGRGFQPEAYAGLGLLYKARAENAGGSGEYDAESRNYDEAARYLDRAADQLGSSPDAITIYQILGLIYERQKKFKEAIAVYETFLRIFPNSSESSAVESFIVQIKKQMNEPK